MLHHYDAVGLLVPDQIDPWNGYRSYSPEQLHQLNRIVALKDLGFTLDQVGRLLHDNLDAGELRGMLRLRRLQLEDEARAVGTRLAAVETRLRMIEKENTMAPDYVVKTIPAVRLAARTATLDSDRLGEHIEPMFDAVATALRDVCGSLATPVAAYAETEAGMDVVVGYAYPGPPPEGTEVVDLPECTAVCGVHLARPGLAGSAGRRGAIRARRASHGRVVRLDRARHRRRDRAFTALRDEERALSPEAGRGRCSQRGRQGLVVGARRTG